MAQQSSRLHRLLTLLDTGSTQSTRFTAAQQIGEIVKSHPHDLNSLLKKVSLYLRSKNWDTRVAAARAVGAIAENVKHTSIQDLLGCVEAEMLETGIPLDMKDRLMSLPNIDPGVEAGLSFKSFDIFKVLDCGSPLVASGGQEYDVSNDNNKNPAERLARQKQNLRRRLGLDVCEQFMDVNEMIRDEDLSVNKNQSHENGGNSGYFGTGQNIQQLVSSMVPRFVSKRLSARELNMLKRKAKVSAKDHPKGWSEEDDSDTLCSNAPRTTSTEPMNSNKALDRTQSSKVNLDSLVDENNEQDGKWPFHYFVEQLIHDMFDPIWEVRHGTIMALREILTHHGPCAEVLAPDLSYEISRLIDGGYGSKDDTDTQSKNVDRNMQFSAEDDEPVLKKQKISYESGLIETVPLTNHFSANLRCEDSTFEPKPETINDEFQNNDVKMEPGISMDVPLEIKEFENTSLKLIPKEKIGADRKDILIDLPPNCKLMTLFRLTRHSWIKNWEFLQDCAIRFLCVLSLDRFGDYVSDQVVAPVRETCAQALGAALKYMHPSLVQLTLSVLIQMQYRPEWEIRHGSLLGIKYLVAIRREMVQDLFRYILPACRTGLADPDDDVRAVAAEALIPASPAIVSLAPHVLHSIVLLLWDILLDLDDLSPSTSSVMNLLAEIYSQPEMTPKLLEASTSAGKQEFDLNAVVQNEEQEERKRAEENPYILSALAPRLWPFLRHNITSVRLSSIQTLERLLEAGSKGYPSSMNSSLWPASTLGDALRMVFQNLLLESNEEILQCSERVWRLLLQSQESDLEIIAMSYFSSWLQLATTPYGSSLDPDIMFWPVAPPRKSHFRAAAKMRAAKLENESTLNYASGSIIESNVFEKGTSAPARMKIIVGADSEKSVTCTRVITASALGVLASKLPRSSFQFVMDTLHNDLTSLSGVHRQVASIILASWFKELKNRDPPIIPESLVEYINPMRQRLLDLLTCTDSGKPLKGSDLPYSELSRTYLKMRNEAGALLHMVETSGLFKDSFTPSEFTLDTAGVDDAISLASKLVLPTRNSIGKETLEGGPTIDDIETSRQRLLSTSGYLKCVQNNLHITVSALEAASVVWMSILPTRLNPVILPLMAAIRREQEEILQQKAAEALAELISHCTTRKPNPNDKLIKNICSMTCMDPFETPQASSMNSLDIIEEHGLLNLVRITNSNKGKAQLLSSGGDRTKVEGFISRRGSELALKQLCDKFGSSLFDKLPKLWDCLTEILTPIGPEESPNKVDSMEKLIDPVVDPQALINNIQVVRSIATVLDENLKPKFLALLPSIFKCVSHQHVAVRLAASRCITSMAKSMTSIVMEAVIEKVIPLLGDSTSVHARQGAGMLVSLLVQGLGCELIPYAPLLVVPLLRCMSDSDHSVRQGVTNSFAAIVPLLPLSRGLPPPTRLSERLSRNTEDAEFLEQLLDNTHIGDYKLSIELKVTLRRYQQEGINWLSFLRRFKLHGILCDDMGLGKTLQASAIVGTDIAEHRASNKTKDPLSLIICPSTLVGHWAYEIEKYIDSSILSPLQYTGSLHERSTLRSHFQNCNVIIASYDVVRKDIDYLGHISWNYCILDEGHIIKNSKSKITGAVKQLKAEHRLILSGTPIQNNVLELWSLFDFLMPGFLGTERQFQSTFGKPLLAAKDPKCSSKEAEAGALAMEALHKQVMPFLLRRTKKEVLSDLPEKIIQDRYCDLSLVQLKLYEQFSASDARKEISTLVKGNECQIVPEETIAPKTSSHVFQAIQYLLKLCSHPLLVVGERPLESISSIISELIPESSDIVSELHKLHHSPKLVALKEILEECGIGSEAIISEGSSVQHRVLVFAQHKSFLDIIERDLFQTNMRCVTYLRLDGSVEPDRRFEIVKTFNSDPTIDVLLLTTHVGGLGLNLTSADTLVFMEHDWNPMRDHQAMDRAHRLGQRKVVNVHRLIMRGTLEEKVMSLQKFKMSVANAIINSENASLKTMNTDQLLDLFTSTQNPKMGTSVSKNPNNFSDVDAKSMGVGKGLKSILNGLEELWDQSQYTEEYDLQQFLAKLNG